MLKIMNGKFKVWCNSNQEFAGYKGTPVRSETNGYSFQSKIEYNKVMVKDSRVINFIRLEILLPKIVIRLVNPLR